MITIVNYGLGNIRAFGNIYRRLGVEVQEAKTPDELRRADKIILPGVGAFDWAMTRLNDSGLRETLDERVLQQNVKVLGVCVGMQMMAIRSDEGCLPGLGWIAANVVRFNTDMLKSRICLPHMGWNDIHFSGSEPLLRGLVSPRFYFLHSYYMDPFSRDDVIATARYGLEFTAAVRSGNVYGTQFHPEKSHHWGIGLLKNFAEL